MNPSSHVADAFNDDTVVVSVLVAASPEVVWKYLSDAERFAAWIGASAGQPPLAGTRVEPRVGGKLRVEYPGGHAAVGEITAVEPLKRVALSWGYENGQNGITAGATQVEITLHPAAGGTRVQLRHTGIPNAAAAQGHFGGWKHYLTMLARMASDGQQVETLPGMVAAYFNAWSEPDESLRRQLLAAACEPDVVVRTAWACTDGVEELSAHIANGMKHMPGMVLRQDGAAQTVHGYARIAWTVRAPNGVDVMRGESFVRMSLGGRIASLVSFASN